MNCEPTTPDQVCGACAKFEPARDEPRNDIRYGYCKSHLALEREQNPIAPRARLVGVGQRCFMSVWTGDIARPAFEPKPKEKT